MLDKAETNLVLLLSIGYNPFMFLPDALLDAEYLNLATFRKNGAKVETPIWAAPAGTAFYAFSEGKAGKVKRLKNSSRAQLAPCTASGKSLGTWHDANAFIVHDAGEIATAYRALSAKYGWKIAIFNAFSKIGGKFNKRAILRIEIE